MRVPAGAVGWKTLSRSTTSQGSFNLREIASKIYALLDTLEGLRQSDLRRRSDMLRRKEPASARDLMGRDSAEIKDSMVSTYAEDGAVEMRRKIDCLVEAERLLSVMEASGKSLICDPWGKEHFVDKAELIHKVSNFEPVWDELLTEGVIQQESYDRVRALPTSEEKMRELLDHLKTVGVEGKVIFYNTIEKPEPHLLENIMMPAVAQEPDVGHSSLRDHSSNVTEKMRTMMVTGSQMSPEDDWIKLEPEVNFVDTPTYSLQSEAGNFECSVSGLRWVCKKKVSFKYQFGFWEEHMERLETQQYIPGGPLLDITVIAGKLDEVYLPHWICTNDNPTILGKFAVLHVDTCGDVVEQVAEVTPTHVKLSKTVFSLRGVLMRAGFSLKINCQVLIYKTNKPFLTLHVYLIPRDPALQETIKHKEISVGHKMIEKPYPESSLKMRDYFVLTADKDGAEICPEKLKLVYEISDPNFFEVFIDKPDSDFHLTLSHDSVPVWTCEIRRDDCQNTGDIQEKCDAAKPPSVLPSPTQLPAEGEEDEELARVRSKLVEGLSTEVINQLLDDLLEDAVLNGEEKDSILQENTGADRARCLIDTVMKKGRKASRKLFTHLHSTDPTLHAGLGLPSGRPV